MRKKLKKKIRVKNKGKYMVWQREGEIEKRWKLVGKKRKK